jgi:hypothetical protein
MTERKCNGGVASSGSTKFTCYKICFYLTENITQLVTNSSRLMIDIQYAICDSHGGEDVDAGLLGCDAVWTCG